MAPRRCAINGESGLGTSLHFSPSPAIEIRLLGFLSGYLGGSWENHSGVILFILLLPLLQVRVVVGIIVGMVILRWIGPLGLAVGVHYSVVFLLNRVVVMVTWGRFPVKRGLALLLLDLHLHFPGSH